MIRPGKEPETKQISFNVFTVWNTGMLRTQEGCLSGSKMWFPDESVQKIMVCNHGCHKCLFLSSDYKLKLNVFPIIIITGHPR